MPACRWSLCLILPLCVITTTAIAQSPDKQTPDASPVAQAATTTQSQQVQLVLNKYCVGCHNPRDHEADFSAASLASVREGTPDGAVLIPGQPDQSKLLDLLTGKQEPAMPPEDEPQPTQAEIEVLREWVAKGAPLPENIPGPSTFVAPKLPAAPVEDHYVSAACGVGNERYAIGALHSVTLLERESERVIWSLGDLLGKVNSLRPSADRRWLVAGGGVAGMLGEAALIESDSGQVVHRFSGHDDAVYCAALSPNHQILATGSYDRSVILWDVASGEPLRVLTGHNGAIYDLDFDASGELLVTASADQTIKLWQVETGLRLDTFGQPEGEQRCVRFSPDGKYVFAAGTDRQIRKWQIVARDKPAIHPMLIARYAHEADILQLVCLDNNRLLSTSADRTVKLWQTGNLSLSQTVHETNDVPSGLCHWLSNADDLLVVELTGKIHRLRIGPSNHQPAAADALIKAAQATRPPRPNGPSKTKNEYQDSETNNTAASAQPIDVPAQIVGTIGEAGLHGSDQDMFRFFANRGERWIVEVAARKDGSPLDSFIDILDGQGDSVLRTRLQAVRESYFTFRGKDSSTSDDFRLHKWEDMELDEYLYSNGEVNRLWLYPRGPDSGFKVYPGFGERYAYFDTTPLAHALGEPTYVVRELAAGQTALPNGLPVFELYYENDDDSRRQNGADSRLTFVAPADGEYVLRIRDARGFGGPDYVYQATVRRPKPDFELTLKNTNMKMPPGSGREWSVNAQRIDGLQSAISIELSGLPPGLIATNPVIIEAEQDTALGCVFVSPSTSFSQGSANDAQADSSDTPAATSTTEEGEAQSAEPSEQSFEISLTARATVDGREIVKVLPETLAITIDPSLKEVQLRLMPVSSQPGTDSQRELEELTIHPGETISARVVVQRNGTQSRIGFGKEDSGRNLPHGAFVDNIGLNGLLITEEQNEREFFITAAAKVAPGRRQFHLQGDTKGNPTSRPIWLNVLSNE